MKFDNYTINRTCRLIRFHDYRMAAEAVEIRKAINLIGEDLFADLLAFQKADSSAKKPEVVVMALAQLEKIEAVYQEILDKKQCTSLKMLAVTGKDLIQAGMKPGKEMGTVLEQLLQHVLEYPEDNQKEILIQRWKEGRGN